MKTGLTIISIILASLIIGWAIWVNREEVILNNAPIEETIYLTSGQPDYSTTDNLADCLTVECALQQLDSEEIADFQFKNWLQSYVATTPEYADCNWDWDLFEERIEGVKEIRQKMILENRRQSIGITCDFLQPAVE